MNTNAGEDASRSQSVAVDVMGADHGPEVIVRGALEACRDHGIPVTLVGDEAKIFAECQRFQGIEELSYSIIHAPSVITMEDKPVRAVRSKADSSICISYQLVKEKKAIAVVSPGNTGAMMAAGLFISGTLPGISRPAIASMIPNAEGTPSILLDSGANTECSSEQLVQFAFMGHFYARVMLGKERPRVALLSNGTEQFKGTDKVRAAAMILAGMKDINYVGYVEGRDVATEAADVVVCDGFIGNIVLKTMEGSVELAIDSMKAYVNQSLKARIGMFLARSMFKDLFREKLDKSAYGGAPLLGLSDVGIVCHGSSDERAIRNAVKVAKALHDDGLVDKVRQMVSTLDTRPGNYEDGMWSRIEHKLSGTRDDRSDSDGSESGNQASASNDKVK